jgi:hypothetical protein
VLRSFRRLRTRSQRCADRRAAFLKFGCAVIRQRLFA